MVAAPIGLTASCMSQEVHEFDDKNHGDFKNFINTQGSLKDVYGQITEEHARRIWNKLIAWAGKEYNPTISFYGAMSHKVSKTVKNKKFYDYILLFSGPQKTLNNLSQEWHDIDSQWYTDFDDVTQSFIEAWSEVDESESESRFNVNLFRDVIAVLTFQHDANGEEIGKMYKVANFNNKIKISSSILTMSHFDDVELIETFKDTWLEHKNDEEWKIKNSKYWSQLKRLARALKWNEK